MSENEEISIAEIFEKVKSWFQFILNKWKLIAICSLVTAAIGLAYSILQKPKYTAELSFALEEKGAGSGTLGAYAGIASQFGFDLGGGGGGAFSGDNILELMKSRLLIEKTLLTKAIFNTDTQLLIQRYISFNKINKKWKPELQAINFQRKLNEPVSRAEDSILGLIIKDIKTNQLNVAKLDKKLSIVSVNLTSTDEDFAKIFVEELVKNVTDFYIETKTKKSRVNVDLLTRRTDSVKNALDREMYGAAINQDQNNNIIQARAKVPAIKKQMNIQMLSTMYGELVKNLEFSKLALMREEPFIQIIDKPILPLNKVKLGKVKGIILGGMLGAFLSVLFFTIQRLLNSLK